MDRKLARAPQEIAETLIGHRVFGRPSTYNTGEDSIVRTEARLLRQHLERYFSKEGASEPIMLEIPKESYVPVFYRRDHATAIPPSPPEPAPPRSRVALWLLLCACTLAGLGLWRLVAIHPQLASGPSFPLRVPGAVELESSDTQLVRSFKWAKQRALGYTYTGDAAGEWYDSTAGKMFPIRVQERLFLV